jgi:hypothetical protein
MYVCKCLLYFYSVKFTHHCAFCFILRTCPNDFCWKLLTYQETLGQASTFSIVLDFIFEVLFCVMVVPKAARFEMMELL